VTQWVPRPLRPELAAPLGVWQSSQLTRCAGGRAGWRLSADVAVLCCSTAPAPSAKTPGAALAGRPSAFQAGHIPSWHGSCERYALSLVAAGCRWSLLLLSRLLSAAIGRTDISLPARTVQGMARVRSGQAPAWPLVSDRSVRRGSRVKRDIACTLTVAFPPVLVALRAQSRLRLEGRTRTLSGPSPDLSPARTLAPFPGVVRGNHCDQAPGNDL
jgi:hypothetical protein